MFGCHTFVSNLTAGGRKGYSSGIFMSKVNVPPSYGVRPGPAIVALKCMMPSPSSRQLMTSEVERLASMLRTSLRIRLFRLVVAMVKTSRQLSMSSRTEVANRKCRYHDKAEAIAVAR